MRQLSSSKPFSSYLAVCAALALSLPLFGCGGGGGGGDEDFVGAAEVALELTPTTIDTGDQALLNINLSNVAEKGILLKLRIPEAVTYVVNSAKLVVDDNEVDIGPATNASKDNFRYIVFFLSHSSFSEEGTGRVKLLIEGQSRLSDGKVAVDADVNDPLIADGEEFSVNNPQFEQQDEVSLEVRSN